MRDLGLIFDRTNNDLLEDTEKAYIDHEDLNRVGNAVEYISGVFLEMGYDVKTTPKTDWAMTDIRTDEAMDVLCHDVNALRNTIAVTSDTPILDKITYTNINNANAVEKILFNAQKSIEGVRAQAVYCGEPYSGELW